MGLYSQAKREDHGQGGNQLDRQHEGAHEDQSHGGHGGGQPGRSPSACHRPRGQDHGGEQADADAPVERGTRPGPDRRRPVGGQDRDVQPGACDPDACHDRQVAGAERAIACGPSNALRSAAVSHACHSAASVISAAASTTARGTLPGRTVAALMRRATDSPRTIRTKIRNRSARWDVLSGTRRRGASLASAPTASVSRPAAQNAYRTGAATASEDNQSAPPAPKKTKYQPYSWVDVNGVDNGRMRPGRTGIWPRSRHIVARPDQGGHSGSFHSSRVSSEIRSPR